MRASRDRRKRIGHERRRTRRRAAAKLDPKTALDWNLIAVNTVRSPALSPAEESDRGHDLHGLRTGLPSTTPLPLSADAISRTDRPLPPAPVGASPRAAVAAAAYTTLAYYFPTLAPSLVSAYDDYLDVRWRNCPKSQVVGVAVGAAAAIQLIASRWGDGRDAPVATPSAWRRSPGTWVFAPPPSLQSAQTPWVANMKPFMLESADQFRRTGAVRRSRAPSCRPALNEVQTIGSATSTTRTPAQTATAQFWVQTSSASTTRCTATSRPATDSTSSTQCA